MKKNEIVLIKNLSVSVSDVVVVKNVSLSVEQGAVHAIMGPNGSGKSSLAYALAGHPNYHLLDGSITINGVDVANLPAHERARLGFFLAFQNPCEIPGVSVVSFLREAYSAVKGVHISVTDFNVLLAQRCEQLAIDQSFLARGLNEGFSGGEKKRLELLQMFILQPKIVVFDEIDSGLDIDALKIVAQGIKAARAENPSLAIILITHYQRILDYISPDYVHILRDGQIIESGSSAIVQRLESQGYGGG